MTLETGLDDSRRSKRAELDAAIDSARQRLLADYCDGSSEPDANRRFAPSANQVGGYWCGELEADSTLESDYIVFLFLLDRKTYRTKIEKLARSVIGDQLEDGGWNIYEGGPSEISASVKAYVALKLAGYSESDPRLLRARDRILRLGGVEAVNSYSKIYLALLQMYPWDRVPALPPEVVLLPRFFYFNIYEISYWSRAILIPLSILYAKWPVIQSSQEITIDEIIFDRDERPTNGDLSSNAGVLGPATDSSNGTGASDESAPLVAGVKPQAPTGNGVHGSVSPDGNGVTMPTKAALNGKAGGLFSWRNFFLTVNRVLQIVEKTPVKPLRGLALKKAEEWMVARLEDSDGLGAIFPSMINSVLAMRCLGYANDHPLMVEAIEKLEELEITSTVETENGEKAEAIHLQPCLSPVWDTALALNALGEIGYPAEATEMVDSARWLVSKEVRRAGDWQKRVRKAEVSGWAFQFRNDFYPDIDDTAAVIMGLGRVAPQGVEGIDGAMARGINWMLSLQCSSGGWAAFDADVEREIFNEVPYADHNAMLDPACADITGRVLEMLGRLPSLGDHPRVREAIRRGVEYLKDSQEKDGSWYGRWGVNYVYGTWQALKGLMEVGETSDQPYIRRAITYLKSCQNEDGGWGESCASYDDATFSGQGVSTASQTGWALMGLIAAGEIQSAAVDRGVKYLLDTQLEDGGWHDRTWTGTGFPSVFYLKYHLYQLYFPLFALGYYRNRLDGKSSTKELVEIDLERRYGERREDALSGRARDDFVKSQQLARFGGLENSGLENSGLENSVLENSGNGTGVDKPRDSEKGESVPTSTRARLSASEGSEKKGALRSLFGFLG